jgi:hypothetical protein
MHMLPHSLTKETIHLKISGFPLPKISLGNLIGSSALSNVTSKLKNIVGDFAKSSFEAITKKFFNQLTNQAGLSSPSMMNIGAPRPLVTGGAAGTTAGSQVGTANAAGKFDPAAARKLIADNMGEDMAKEFDKLPQAQQKEMAMQTALQKTMRTSQLLTNMLQTLHEMSKAIIQNTRG